MNDNKQKDAPRFEPINRNRVVLAPLDVEKLIWVQCPREMTAVKRVSRV